MNFDILSVPFSRRGSYIAVSRFPENIYGHGNKEGVYLRTIHGISYIPCITIKKVAPFTARIVPVWNGEEIGYELTANASEIRMITAHGEVKICFAGTDTLLIAGSDGLGVNIEAFRAHAVCATSVKKEHRFIINHATSSGRKFLLSPQKGTMTSVREKATLCMRPDENGEFLVGIEDVAHEWMPGERKWDYDSSLAESRKDFADFLKSMPEIPELYQQAGELAAYIDWSCIVKKRGNLTRDAMLMAKNWMCNVWSWDHCFNAIALSYGNPAAAWDQLMLNFDYQHESGCLPDSVSDVYALWAAVKPPVHGWALSKIIEHTELTDEQMEEAYDRLSKWTDWWLNWRDEDEDGICEYQDGCDSGWDNSTAFRKHAVVETPDLSAFLILQMEMLKTLAEKLNRPREAASWQEKADTMFQKMMEHSFENNRPKSVFSTTHETVENESLILYLPLLLGKRLPEEIRNNMIEDLKTDRFLTANGLATESVHSPMYIPDGYWQGPIWAPSTMLLVDGLNKCGETEFAKELSRRFCDMAARSGFAENYDALTGEGLRDRAYTWTSSVFLILANEYLL